MRYGAEHKEQTRSRVLKAAAKAIRKDGPDKVGVAEVMAEAGLTHGGFYAHFPSKAAMIAEAVGEMFADARTRFSLETADRTPAEGLSAYIDFYLSPRHRDARSTGCPVAALAADLPRLEGEVRARYGEGVASLTGRVAGALRAFGAPEPDALAVSVVAELVGALSLARAVADPAQSDRILETSRAALKQRLGLEPAP